MALVELVHDPVGKIFDSLDYAATGGKPFGLPLHPIKVISNGWTKDGDLDVENSRKIITELPPNMPLIVDVEILFADIREEEKLISDPEAAMDSFRAKFWRVIRLLRMINDMRPDQRKWGLGVYGWPVGGLHPDNDGGRDKNGKWWQEHRRAQDAYTQPIGPYPHGLLDLISWFVISSYPAFLDMDVWDRCQDAQIAEARGVMERAGVDYPIVPFMHPRYTQNVRLSDGTVDKRYAYHFVPGSVAVHMLMRLVEKTGCGVWWDWMGYGDDGNFDAMGNIGHGGKRKVWDPNAPWWYDQRHVLGALYQKKDTLAMPMREIRRENMVLIPGMPYPQQPAQGTVPQQATMNQKDQRPIK